MLSDRCPVCLSVCLHVGVLWPNGWMDQNETWHGGRPRPMQLSAHVYCAQAAGWIKMPLGTEVGLDLGDIVLDGDPAPP